MSEKKGLSARKYLEQLQEIDICINQELEQLEEMKSGAGGVGAIDYSKDRVQTSPVNAIERRVCSYVDFEERINAHIDQFVDAKEQIIAEIRGLHHKHYISILFKIYVQYKSIREAAGEMKLSYRYAVEVHKKALKAFEDIHKNLHYIT
ncbi:MAG: hypothetical protein NC543_08360 [bacterium]|nr:hypothetical protein [bacterium]MCM1373593.1 hypothetical protein [Muribaculum sp.]